MFRTRQEIFMNRNLRSALLTASLALAGVAMTSAAAVAENARVNLTIYKAGFIVGASGGRGTVTFRGRTYPVNIGGVSLGATIGASKAQLVGTARNLRTIRDITGVYTAAGAGLALAGGGRVAELQNANGVNLHLQGRQIGFMFSIDLSGLQLSLR
jgi:hypothetical protein